MPDVNQRLNFIVTAQDAASSIIAGIGTSLGTLPDKAAMAGADMGTRLSGAVMDQLHPAAWAEGAEDIGREIFSGIGRGAKSAISSAIQDAFNIDPGVATAISGTLVNIVDTITGPFQTAIVTRMGTLGGEIALKLADSSIVAAISPVAAALGSAIGWVMDLAIAAAPLLLPALLIAAIVGAIVLVVNDPGILGKAAQVGIDIVVGIIRGIGGLLGGAVSLGVQMLKAVVDALVNIVHGAADLATAAADIGVSIVRGLIDGILGLVGGAISLAVQLLTAVVDATIAVPLAIVVEAAKIGVGIVTGIIQGLGDLGQKLLDFITGVLRSIEINVGPFHISGTKGVSIDMPTIDIGDFHSGGGGSGSGKGSTVPGLAMGGPVMAGQAYIVGERQPELFIPGSNGQIVPSVGGLNLAAGAIQINGANKDPRAIAREVMYELQRRMTVNGQTSLTNR